MPKYWFEPKKYGWGFVPATTEGWLATLVLLILLVISLETNGLLNGHITSNDILRFLFDLFIITGVFTLTMQGKVKGGLKWQWNGKKTRKTTRKRRKR